MLTIVSQEDFMPDSNTKDQIIKSMLNTAFYKSAGETSLANIAEGVSIKKASIYNHFNSREHLIEETCRSCKEYIEQISFIPSDIDSVSKKYPAETVLKGIADRYFKMHEKQPLLQIYTFIQSQKYFSPEVMEIIQAQKTALISQTEKVLLSLIQNEKINLDSNDVHSTAMWFCSAINDMLCNYLLERKKDMLPFPEKNADKMANAKGDDAAIEKINAYIEKFAELLK